MPNTTLMLHKTKNHRNCFSDHKKCLDDQGDLIIKSKRESSRAIEYSESFRSVLRDVSTLPRDPAVRASKLCKVTNFCGFLAIVGCTFGYSVLA